ncbi:hypothetical protein [Muriicola sp.]|uniref:hypothetical protein n=1 Tax=Muriicola sp. TaxID=2020856 RepID=UPI003C718E2C
MDRKEIFWLVGTVGLVLVLTFVLFGLDGFRADSTFDYNIHDTYFVIADIHIVPLLVVLTFFTVYLFRTIRQKFKNFTVNVILIIATILFVLVLGKTIVLLDLFGKPTINTEFNKDENPVGYALKILSDSMFIVQTGLLVFLAYTGYKTGQNYIAKENKH